MSTVWFPRDVCPQRVRHGSVHGTNTHQNAQSRSDTNRELSHGDRGERARKMAGENATGRNEAARMQRGHPPPARPPARSVGFWTLCTGTGRRACTSLVLGVLSLGPCPSVPEGRGRAGDHITYSLSQSWRPLPSCRASRLTEVSRQEGGRVGAPGRVQRGLSREKGQGREWTLLTGAMGDFRRVMSAVEKTDYVD